jgi:2-phosphosulfolactate phosphatase
MLKRDASRSVTVVIDAFRAFATASFIFDRMPADYLLATSSQVARRLATERPDVLLIGKPEIGADLTYDIPNSPARSLDVRVAGRTVIHRTEAGARGVLLAGHSDVVLVAGFVNAGATAHLVNTLGATATLRPMGHEATTPSLEDDLCAALIQARIDGRKFDLGPHLRDLREGPGRYFFGENQTEYPRRDFDLCTEIDRFAFAIRAHLVGDYARLERC